MRIRHAPFDPSFGLDQIHDLLRRIYAHAGPRVALTVGDLEYWRFQTDDPVSALATAELWFADDTPVGFVWPEDAIIDLAVHPAHADLLPAMLDWGEAWPGHAKGEVTTPALDSEAAYTRLLRARGYEPTDEVMHRYRVRSLADPVAPGRVPDGYAIQSGPNTALVHARPSIPADSCRALPTSPIYRTDLDLYVTAPDGEPAAFALVWFDAPNRAGLFEPVGCLPDHRRRGLATALLCEGCHRLRALGATHARVANAVGNEAAGALYASAGFEANDRRRTWRKPL